MAERGVNQGQIRRERKTERGDLSDTVLGVLLLVCALWREVLFTMAGTVFGRLSLEEGDSANSLEGLEIKLGGEGKNTNPYLLFVCL